MASVSLNRKSEQFQWLILTHTHTSTKIKRRNRFVGLWLAQLILVLDWKVWHPRPFECNGEMCGLVKRIFDRISPSWKDRCSVCVWIYCCAAAAIISNRSVHATLIYGHYIIWMSQRTKMSSRNRNYLSSLFLSSHNTHTRTHVYTLYIELIYVSTPRLFYISSSFSFSRKAKTDQIPVIDACVCVPVYTANGFFFQVGHCCETKQWTNS